MKNRNFVLIILGAIVLAIGGFYVVYKMLTYISPTKVEEYQHNLTRNISKGK